MVLSTLSHSPCPRKRVLCQSFRIIQCLIPVFLTLYTLSLLGSQLFDYCQLLRLFVSTSQPPLQCFMLFLPSLSLSRFMSSSLTRDQPILVTQTCLQQFPVFLLDSSPVSRKETARKSWNIDWGKAFKRVKAAWTLAGNKDCFHLSEQLPLLLSVFLTLCLQKDGAYYLVSTECYESLKYSLRLQSTDFCC